MSLFCLFWPPPFSLSLSLSLSIVMIFLPSFLFLRSVSCSCLLLLFCLFLFQDVILFVFFCLFFCFVLNHNARFGFALHLVFLLLFFVLVALVFCYFLIFGYLSKTSLKFLDIAKKQKWIMQKDGRFWEEQLAQVYSQIMTCFTFLCFFKMCMFCSKHNKNRGIGQKKKQKTSKKQKTCYKNWSKVVLNIGPSMLRNKLDQFLTQLFVFPSFCFFWKSSSFCREKESLKKNRNLDQFLLGLLC